MSAPLQSSVKAYRQSPTENRHNRIFGTRRRRIESSLNSNWMHSYLTESPPPVERKLPPVILRSQVEFKPAVSHIGVQSSQSFSVIWLTLVSKWDSPKPHRKVSRVPMSTVLLFGNTNSTKTYLVGLFYFRV